MSDSIDDPAFNYILLVEYLMFHEGIEIVARKHSDGKQEIAWFLPDGTPHVSRFLDNIPREILTHCFEENVVKQIQRMVYMNKPGGEIEDLL